MEPSPPSGDEAVIQINVSGDQDAPVWEDFVLANDITTTAQYDKVEAPKCRFRPRRKSKRYYPGDAECTAEFSICHVTSDTGWQLMKSQIRLCRPVHLRCFDGDPAGDDCRPVEGYEWTAGIESDVHNKPNTTEGQTRDISLYQSAIGIDGGKTPVDKTDITIPQLP